MHKLHAVGFPVDRVVSGIGACPLPPVARNDYAAIGRTNDAILYGGSVHLTVAADDAELAAVVPRLPASASAQFGQPFAEILDAVAGDFYAIDPLLFSPAEVALTSVASGRTFRAGEVAADVLRASFSS
jgi:methenyltetrahydromethanopterin cyclohydrolase